MLLKMDNCGRIHLATMGAAFSDRVDEALRTYKDYLKANPDPKAWVAFTFYTFSLRALPLSQAHKPFF
jgi:hypothetical protein